MGDLQPLTLSAAEASMLANIAGYSLEHTPGAAMNGFAGTPVWSNPGADENCNCPRDGAKAHIRSYWWGDGGSLLSFVSSESTYIDEKKLTLVQIHKEVWTWQYAN